MYAFRDAYAGIGPSGQGSNNNSWLKFGLTRYFVLTYNCENEPWLVSHWRLILWFLNMTGAYDGVDNNVRKCDLGNISFYEVREVLLAKIALHLLPLVAQLGTFNDNLPLPNWTSQGVKHQWEGKYFGGGDDDTFCGREKNNNYTNSDRTMIFQETLMSHPGRPIYREFENAIGSDGFKLVKGGAVVMTVNIDTKLAFPGGTINDPYAVLGTPCWVDRDLYATAGSLDYNVSKLDQPVQLTSKGALMTPRDFPLEEYIVTMVKQESFVTGVM